MSLISASQPICGHTRAISSLPSVLHIRFTLRELLLLVLTCAAFFGWAHIAYHKSQPFRATHVAEYFVDELPKDVAAVRTSLGEQGAAWSVASPLDKRQLLARVNGKEHVRLDWSCDLLLPWEKAYRLRCELIRRIIGQIKQDDLCDESGARPQTDDRYLGQWTVGMAGDYYEDEIRYRDGDIYGELRICLLGVNERPPRLLATLHEWRPR